MRAICEDGMYYESLVVWNCAGYWDRTDFRWSISAVCHQYSRLPPRSRDDAA
jgi:hypothetical protein